LVEILTGNVDSEDLYIWYLVGSSCVGIKDASRDKAVDSALLLGSLGEVTSSVYKENRGRCLRGWMGNP